jgi:hypothetical protein
MNDTHIFWITPNLDIAVDSRCNVVIRDLADGSERTHTITNALSVSDALRKAKKLADKQFADLPRD